MARKLIRPQYIKSSPIPAEPAIDRAARLRHTKYNQSHTMPQSPHCTLGNTSLAAFTLQKSASWAYQTQTDIPSVKIYKPKKIKRGKKTITKLILAKEVYYK